jgi:diacylglycerol kinase family enzyme
MIDELAGRRPAHHRSRFLLHENPIAGVARRTLTDDVVTVLQRRGASVTRLSPGTDLAALDWPRLTAGHDAILSAGGDGTLRHVASRMPPGALPIGLIPRGTGNVLAEEIGLTRAPTRIADTLLHGPTVTITGARANGQPFYLMAGIGLDGEAVRRLDLAAKQKWGKSAYTRPLITSLAMPEPALRVTADGDRTAEAAWAIVANARRYGGAFKLSDRAGLHRPGLLVYLMPRGGMARRLAHVTALGLGALDRLPGVIVWSATELDITADFPSAVQIDGDPFATVPLKIKWGEPKLALIVPEAYVANLGAASADAANLRR